MWGVDWIELTQDSDRWRALVKEVINLRVPLYAVIPLLAGNRLHS